MTVVTQVCVWHGTDAALQRLAAAVQEHCTCDREHQVVCAPHRMLTDQHVLDHLAFVESTRTAYIEVEFDPRGEWL